VPSKMKTRRREPSCRYSIRFCNKGGPSCRWHVVFEVFRGKLNLSIIFILCIQLDQDKINALSKRVDEAVAERMELHRKLDKGEKDTHEFVNYFQQELEKKVWP
jgi:hypothetical protein